MVNHAETLLLNMPGPKAAELALSCPGMWLEDRSFPGVKRIPAGVSGMYDELFRGTSSDESRVDRVLSAVGIALTGDMERYFNALDSRRTILYGGDGTLAGLFSSRRSGDSGFETAFVGMTTKSSGLFADTGIRRLDLLIPGLKSIVMGCDEEATRFSAALALLCYRLEAERVYGR